MVYRFTLSCFLALIFVGIASAQTDQNVIYGSFFGGNQDDFVSTTNAAASLGETEWLLTGLTLSSNFWTSDDAFQVQSNVVFGGTAFITRFDASGMPVYSTYFGGSTNMSDSPSIAVSPNGDKYCLGGTTQSIDFPVTADAYNTVFEGDRSGFVSCFGDDNQMLWSTFLGSSDYDGVSDLFIAEDGIYVSGFTEDPNLGTPGTFAPDFPDNLELCAFISKFDHEGELIWLSYLFGPEAFPGIREIETSPDGSRIYIYAWASDGSIPVTPGAHQDSFGGFLDGGLLCFSAADGDLLWATYFGGEQMELANEMSVGPDGSVCISGRTESDNQIATPGSHQEERAGQEDWYIAKFTADGENVWGTYYGGEQAESVPSLSFLEGSLYLTGNTTSVSGLTFGNPFEPELSEGSRASLMAKFDQDQGELVWATYIGAENQTCAPATRHTPISGGKFAFFGSTLGSSLCPSYITDDAFQSSYPGGDLSIWYGILQENTLSVSDSDAPQSARLFPNPASEEVYIDLPDVLFSAMDVQVFDLSGRLVLSVDNLNQGGALNISALGNGIYLLRASANRKMYTGKLTVTR